MLMSDSIGGNAKTLMFVNCSPANYNVPESNSSLTFAMRCKDIKNNTSSSSAGIAAIQLNALKKELNKLKKDKGVVSNSHAALTRPT
jgi:kinesin family member 5